MARKNSPATGTIYQSDPIPMQTIPGIHVATSRFNRADQANDIAVTVARHMIDARLSDWLSARVDSRYSPTHMHAVHEEGVTVLLDGYLTQITGQSVPLHAPAAAMLALYLESGLDFLSRLRGSYTGLILDRRSNQAHLFNDRRASRPLYYRQDADTSLLAGPEIAHLAQAAPALHEIDPVAVCEFLIFASNYNDRTLFPTIKKLPPASVMTIGRNTLAMRRYWHIRIEPEKARGSEHEWVKEALALFNQSTQRLLAHRTRPFLYLSGGLDSRVILGGLRENGYHIPAVTYGTEEGDDAPIARQLAQHCGLPFTYLPISTADPQSHFVDAALRADCRAETVDTPTLGLMQDQLAETFDQFIQGDKSYYGHHAATLDEALTQAGVLSFAHANRLGDMLEPAVFHHARNSIESTRHDIRTAGLDLDPQDLRDKAYFEQRLFNRQNAFTAANLRQFEQARPWLDEDLVDFLFSMPAALRTDNALAKKMLQTAHPDLAAIPFAHKDSIPQAQTYRQSIPANPALAKFIRIQLHDQLDPRLVALFRPDSLFELIDSLLANKALPIPHTRWWQAFPGMWRIVANRYRTDRLHPISVMLRLMQINLYLTCVESARRPATILA